MKLPIQKLKLAALMLSCFSSAVVSFAVLASDLEVVKPATDFSKAEPYEALPAGAATHKKKVNVDAFSHASANMSFERELDFQLGNAFFTNFGLAHRHPLSRVMA